MFAAQSQYLSDIFCVSVSLIYNQKKKSLSRLARYEARRNIRKTKFRSCIDISLSVKAGELLCKNHSFLLKILLPLINFRQRSRLLPSKKAGRPQKAANKDDARWERARLNELLLAIPVLTRDPLNDETEPSVITVSCFDIRGFLLLFERPWDIWNPMNAYKKEK